MFLSLYVVRRASTHNISASTNPSFIATSVSYRSRKMWCNFDVFMLICGASRLGAKHTSIKTSKLHHSRNTWCNIDVFTLVCTEPRHTTYHGLLFYAGMFCAEPRRTTDQHKNINVTSHFPWAVAHGGCDETWVCWCWYVVRRGSAHNIPT